MNLILFELAEKKILLKGGDSRLLHIRHVLKKGRGDMLYVGAKNGPRGKAWIERDSKEGMVLQVEWTEGFLPTLPLCVIAGMPRPQTARRLLQEGSCLGVSHFYFFNMEKGEPSYADSKLWGTDEWKRHLEQGAEQAFATTVPEVRHFKKLETIMEGLEAEGNRLALDNYEAVAPFSKSVREGSTEYILAIGAERGWSNRERTILRQGGFTLCHLGERVLRMESALITATALIRSQLGHF